MPNINLIYYLIAGGIFGASKGKSNKSKIIGGAAGAIIGAGVGGEIDGC